MQEQVEQLKSKWDALPAGSRMGLLGVATVLLVAVVAIVATSTKPTMAVLYANLSDADGSRIGERLGAMGVKYEFGDERSTILVPERRVHESRMTLASEGLPSGSGVGSIAINVTSIALDEATSIATVVAS